MCSAACPLFILCQICEAFAANRYPFPEDPARQRAMHGEVTARLRELHTTIEAGERHRDSVLQNIAFNLDQWATQVGTGCGLTTGASAMVHACLCVDFCLPRSPGKHLPHAPIRVCVVTTLFSRLLKGGPTASV